MTDRPESTAPEPAGAPVPDDGELPEAPRRGRVALAVAAVLAVVVGGLVVVLAGSDPSTDRSAYTALEGEPVPAVAGDRLLADDEQFDIGDHRGQWVVVNFFSTWCPPCVEEHPELVELDDTYGEEGEIALVSVVYDDDPDAVTEFFRRRGGDWPVLPDPDGRISLDFGVVGVPETYLVDPQGVVREKIVGGVTREGLESFIAGISADLAGAGGAGDPDGTQEGSAP